MFNQWCVNKVLRHFLLLSFYGLSFEFNLLIFFQLPVSECPSALSQLNFWSSLGLYSQGVFFLLETLLVPELPFRDS